MGIKADRLYSATACSRTMISKESGVSDAHITSARSTADRGKQSIGESLWKEERLLGA